MLKLPGNIHPSDTQMNAITSILEGHDTIVSDLPPDWSRQVADLPMYPMVPYIQQRIANEGRTTNVFRLSCISPFIFDEGTSEKPSRMWFVCCVFTEWFG